MLKCIFFSHYSAVSSNTTTNCTRQFFHQSSTLTKCHSNTIPTEQNKKKTNSMQLALSGSHDADVVMYTDVLRPTIERHPMELLRRPDVRSVGIGSIAYAGSLYRSIRSQHTACLFRYICKPMMGMYCVLVVLLLCSLV